jgi:hypothetical protein
MKPTFTLSRTILSIIGGIWLAYLDRELHLAGLVWFYWSGILTLLAIASNPQPDQKNYFWQWTTFLLLCLQFLVLLKYIGLTIIVIGFDPNDGLFSHTYHSYSDVIIHSK